MKKSKTILFGLLFMTILISAFSMDYVAAAPDKEVEVSGDTVQQRVQANEQTQFRFRQRTQLTIQGNVNVDVSIDCDARNIGDKDVIIELEGDGDMNMTMKCTEEQKELGLQKGNAYQTRNRNRYQYQEGFCAEIKCNESCDAKLKIQANDQNQNGQWAYYDDDAEEWVTVDTTLEDGYLVAETDHFSTWTVLTPETDWNLIIGIGIAVAVVALIAVIIIVKKRK